jgi:hypothetical protein
LQGGEFAFELLGGQARGLTRFKIPITPETAIHARSGLISELADDVSSDPAQGYISKDIRQNLPTPIDRYCIDLDYSSPLGNLWLVFEATELFYSHQGVCRDA